MRFVRHLLLALALLTTACATFPTVKTTRFKILQINDVYKIEGLDGGQSGGLARVRWLRTLLESDGTPVLVLHAGDLLYPSVMSKYLDARPMIDVLNLLDGKPGAIDSLMAVTFGNHELDKNDDKVLLARLQESEFFWVTTNTRRCDPACDKLFPQTADLALLNAGDTKIGVIGLLYPMKKSYAESTDVPYAARDAATTAYEQGANVVVALTHQDMPDDQRLAAEVREIDIIIGGHDHLYMSSNVDGIWITKADADAKSVIVYDVTVKDNLVHTVPLRVVLDSTIPKDPQVDAAVQGWLAKLGEKLGGITTIGMTKKLLEGVEPAVRGRETALGNLLADVAREQMQTDVGLVNGGSIRINDNIPPGPITNYDMEGIFYYTNTLVAFRVTGQQLLDMLNNSVSRVDAGDGRFLQVSGLSFSYQKEVKAEDVKVNGKPLDLGASYSVAAMDYMYLRGTEDGYTLFADATRPPKVNTDREADFRKTVEAYIRAKGTVEQDIEGRIVRK